MSEEADVRYFLSLSFHEGLYDRFLELKRLCGLRATSCVAGDRGRSCCCCPALGTRKLAHATPANNQLRRHSIASTRPPPTARASAHRPPGTPPRRLRDY